MPSQCSPRLSPIPKIVRDDAPLRACNCVSNPLLVQAASPSAESWDRGHWSYVSRCNVRCNRIAKHFVNAVRRPPDIELLRGGRGAGILSARRDCAILSKLEPSTYIWNMRSTIGFSSGLTTRITPRTKVCHNPDSRGSSSVRSCIHSTGLRYILVAFYAAFLPRRTLLPKSSKYCSSIIAVYRK